VAGAVPLRFSARPLVATIRRDEELAIAVSGDGRLERIADFLPIGEDRVAGDYRVDLSVKGTAASPEATGRVAVTNGSYSSQDYGTELTAINLELLGDHSSLRLARLSAGDGKSGRLQGSGSVDLAASPSPLLNLQTKLSQILVANTDEAHATVDADLRAGGSLAEPTLYARIVVPRSD